MFWFTFVIFVQIFTLAHLMRTDGFKCGEKLERSKNFVSGNATKVNEWPWLASLFSTVSRKFICGGTIVSLHYVITAAHCVKRKRKKKVLRSLELLVRLGKHNISAPEEEGSEWFHPHEILVHPDWQASEKQFDADLAILVAGIPIPFSRTIAPICLWTDLNENEDYFGTVVGWGSSGTSNNISDVPRQLLVQRVPSSRCYEDFHLIAAIASSRTFCAGGVSDKSVPCSGYSGQ